MNRRPLAPTIPRPVTEPTPAARAPATRVTSKEEAVRLVLHELGDLPSADLARVVWERYGVRIDPKFVPVFRASIRLKEREDQLRQAAQPDLPPRAA